MAIHCFYHGADLDGHCSGAIVKYRFPEAVMHPINYGDVFPWDAIEEEDEIYMVDFCLQPFNQMLDLIRETKIVNWIDHHSSALREYKIYADGENMGDFFLGLRDTSKAACELTWEYLFPDKPVPLAVKLLSLYDSWTYQGHELEPMVLPFQMRMRMEDMNPFNPHSDHAMANWEQWFACDHGCVLVDGDTLLNRFLSEGKLLLRYDEEQKRRYVQTYGFETVFPKKEKCSWCGGSGNYDDRDSTDDRECPDCNGHGYKQLPCGPFKAIAVNLGHTNSKVFDSVWRKECGACYGDMSHISDLDLIEALRDECPRCHGKRYEEPYDLMLTFCRRSDRKWIVSLYSTKEHIDCGSIAKSFGGGGHKGAAGFQCNELPFEY